MKTIMLILLFVSCSHKPLAPDWVRSLRSGEERFKITNGNSLLFRRIAGGYTREHACDVAIAQTKADIKAEYPQYEKVAQSLEVLYYDQDQQDCAVTMSVPTPVRTSPLTRSERAEKYAINGTKKAEFARLMGEQLYVGYDHKSACWQAFYQSGASYHDATSVCWQFGEVVGYCTNLGCTRKYP